MIIKALQQSQGNGPLIVVTCPACGKGGTFERFNNISDLHIQQQAIWLGQRKCPNHECSAHIFFIQTKDKKIITHPPLRIDFDSSNIPSRIKNSLEEAISCHANENYISAGIMVRRTLEELCKDREASGKNLMQRIKSLQDKVVLPSELFEAMDELRLLGNDAAHIKSREYDQIGNNETGIAIELTKEILKAVFQMNSLVEKLRQLKNVNN